MTPAGRRTERITFLRQGESADRAGHADAEWTPFGAAMAEVFWGAGSERRAAARESGSQAAAFRVLSTAKTRGVKVSDRLTYRGEDWDIRSVVEMDRGEVEFDAVRATS